MNGMIPAVVTAFGRRLLRLRGTLGGLLGIGADGMPRIVPVGANDLFLKADDTSADGVSWAPVSQASEFTAGVSTGPNGKVDTRTTGGTSYTELHFALLIKVPMKITAIELVLPPTSTCEAYIDEVSQGQATNATGGHLATSFTIPGGGKFFLPGEYFVSLRRTTGASAFRDAGDEGGADRQSISGTGHWGLKNKIYYGTTYATFDFTPACRLTYIPYTWVPS